MVRQKLENLKPGSAPGPDKVTNRFLKEHGTCLAPVLPYMQKHEDLRI